MFRVLTVHGQEIKEDYSKDITWLNDIDQPIATMEVCGYPVQTAKKYFYAAKFQAPPGGQPFAVGWVFGCIIEDVVKEYTYMPNEGREVQYREYAFSKFPFTHNIIKEGA